ncbi:MAG: hypothetical protein LH613_01940 [Chamaesiphon sp.]|nr:hypothetical protein [Chamaesiphon sp.]
MSRQLYRKKMAKFEAEVGGDLSAGDDWGIHLDRVMELALNSEHWTLPARIEHGKFVELLSEQFGSVMSAAEIEEVATSFQSQIQQRLASKVVG